MRRKTYNVPWELNALVCPFFILFYDFFLHFSILLSLDPKEIIFGVPLILLPFPPDLHVFSVASKNSIGTSQLEVLFLMRMLFFHISLPVFFFPWLTLRSSAIFPSAVFTQSSS